VAFRRDTGGTAIHLATNDPAAPSTFHVLVRKDGTKTGANGTLWAGMQPLNQPPGSPGWLVKLDRKTGKILGYVPVTEKAGLHTVEDAGVGQPMTDVGNRVVWFKRRSFRGVQ
jgi:hypothetical protein